MTSRPSRFMRSMTPSSSVKMTPSKFNLVCGKTQEQATRPDLSRVPILAPPKVIDSRVTTPTLRRRERSVTRDSGYTTSITSRPPIPTRDHSLSALPFGSYAERAIHTKAPNRYTASRSSLSGGYNDQRYQRRRSCTPGGSGYTSQAPSVPPSYPSSRRNSVSLTSNFSPSNFSSSNYSNYSTSNYSSEYSSGCRQRGVSATALAQALGTPAASRGIPFY